MADTLRYVSDMRASIRWAGFLVACAGVAAGAAHALGSPPKSDSPDGPAAKKNGKQTAAEKEAEVFIATTTSLLAPVAQSANLADWEAATDVTPEHTGQRMGADKALAALGGSKIIIEKTKALLKNGKQLDDSTARQLQRLLLGAAESPGTIPEVVAKRVEAEARQSAAARGPPPPTRSTKSCASRGTSASGCGSGMPPRRSAARSSRGWWSWSSCATRSHARWVTARTSRCRSPTTG
jgi:hypothetical protein